MCVPKYPGQRPGNKNMAHRKSRPEGAEYCVPIHPWSRKTMPPLQGLEMCVYPGRCPGLSQMETCGSLGCRQMIQSDCRCMTTPHWRWKQTVHWVAPKWFKAPSGRTVKSPGQRPGNKNKVHMKSCPEGVEYCVPIHPWSRKTMSPLQGLEMCVPMHPGRCPGRNAPLGLDANGSFGCRQMIQSDCRCMTTPHWGRKQTVHWVAAK